MDPWLSSSLLLVGFYALVAVLYLITPGPVVLGYVLHPVTKQKLRYRLNGLRVLAIVLIAFYAAVNTGVVRADILYEHRFRFPVVACVLGLLVTVWLTVRGNPYETNTPVCLFVCCLCSFIWQNTNTSQSTRTISDRLNAMYAGYEDNPQWLSGLFDAKMYLYLIGAVVLSLNVLSFVAHQHFTCVADKACVVKVFVGLCCVV